MSARRDGIVLMTSTIAPKADTYALKRADPADRLRDYADALEFYLRTVGRGDFGALVYVDNSGYPLDTLIALARRAGLADRCEFISYAAETPPHYSRYYLELNLLIEAMQRSATLQEAGEAAIWKVTGRYIVENIASIVAAAPAAFDLCLNLRNRPERVADFFLVGFRRDSFWKTIGKDLEDYRTTEAGEIILRRKIDEGAFGDAVIRPRLARTPKISGVRGFDGARYDGLAYTLKYYLRAAANRVAPWLWI